MVALDHSKPDRTVPLSGNEAHMTHGLVPLPYMTVFYDKITPVPSEKTCF